MRVWDYFHVLEGADRLACVQVAVECAELVLPVWLEVCPDDDRPAAAIRAVRAWLECPCDEHAMRTREAGADALDAVVTAYSGAYAADAAVDASVAVTSYAASYANVAAAKASVAAGTRTVWLVVLSHTTGLTGASLEVAATLAADGWDGTVDELVEAAALLVPA